jgi:hypothetical protein
LQKYIEKKLTLSKLDSALLFFSSSLSLAFGVGYALLGIEWLRFYIPMLLLGWFMPIYIGYVRGSIILDSVEERIRGWIYFIVGLGFYVINPLSNFILEKIFGPSSYFSILIMLPESLIVGCTIGYLSGTVISDVFKIQYKELQKEAKEAFLETRLSAIFLSNLLIPISKIDLSNFTVSLNFSLVFLIIAVFAWLLLLALIIKYEKKARRLLRNLSSPMV